LFSLFFALGITALAFIPSHVDAATEYPAANDAQYYFEVETGFTATQLAQMKIDLLAMGIPQEVVDQIQPVGAMDKEVPLERVVPVTVTVTTNDVNSINLTAFDTEAQNTLIAGDANTLEPDADLATDGVQVRLSGLQRVLTSGGIEFSEKRAPGNRPSLNDEYDATVNYRGIERVAGYGAFTATIGDLNIVEVIVDYGTIVFGGGVVGGGGVVVIPPAAVPAAAIPDEEVPLAVPNETDENVASDTETIPDNDIALAPRPDTDTEPLFNPFPWIVIAVVVAGIIIAAIVSRKRRQNADINDADI
jgi:hypothetical protein